MSSSEPTPPEKFCWRFGETQVVLTWDAPHWLVLLYANSRLNGPNTLVSRKEFTNPTHAAFAVMTHVARVSIDDQEGVRQGKLAARWMRAHGAAPGSH